MDNGINADSFFEFGNWKALNVKLKEKVCTALAYQVVESFNRNKPVIINNEKLKITVTYDNIPEGEECVGVYYGIRFKKYAKIVINKKYVTGEWEENPLMIYEVIHHESYHMVQDLITRNIIPEIYIGQKKKLDINTECSKDGYPLYLIVNDETNNLPFDEYFKTKENLLYQAQIVEREAYDYSMKATKRFADKLLKTNPEYKESILSYLQHNKNCSNTVVQNLLKEKYHINHPFKAIDECMKCLYYDRPVKKQYKTLCSDIVSQSHNYSQ